MPGEPWKESKLSADVPHFIQGIQQDMTDIAADIVAREQTEPSSPLYLLPGQDGYGTYGSGSYGS
jgi:uncharacterized protein YukJ